MRIERQRFVEGLLRQRVVVGFAKTFHYAAGMSGAQSAVGQRKRRIKIGRVLKMLDRFVDILARDGVINVPAQTIAATQIFFVSFGVRGLLLFEPDLLVRGQFQTQALANLLRDRVLHVDDVGSVG